MMLNDTIEVYGHGQKVEFSINVSLKLGPHEERVYKFDLDNRASFVSELEKLASDKLGGWVTEDQREAIINYLEDPPYKHTIDTK